jgi:excisionase family DNA binding protein
MPTAANKIRESLDANVLERKPPVVEGLAWGQPKMAPVSQPTAQTSSVHPALVFSQERLLNAREVAARLGVSERWVRDHTSRRNPRIRAVKLGSLVRYKRADVETFMESLDTQRTSRPIQFGV